MKILKASGINPEKKDERDFEAEGAAEDIMRAERHKSDPKMMKRVKKHLKRKKKDVISSLQQLRSVAKEKIESPENDHDEDDM